MALSAAQPEYTFINLTDNPVKNRDERRSFVRRAVMSDYHKRRKRHTNSQDTILSQLRTRTFLGESGQSESVSFEGAINDSSDTYIARSLTPLEQFSIGLFQPKYWVDPQHAQMSRLVTGFLCGQTTKAAQDMSYVAFIHRKFHGACKELDTINNPLKCCGLLLRAFTSGNSSTDLYCAALWDMVHEQQEKIYKQIETLGKWELLSASQAITLYILLWLRMRRSNGKFAHGNIALLFTLGKIFKFLTSQHLHADANSSMLRPVHNWKDWVFQESCFRVATVYFILTLIVATDIGFSCDGPSDWCIEKMPLPATKASWEAGNEAAWMDTIGGSLNFANRPTFGDLFSNRDLQHCTDDSWEEGLDEMGLISSVASRLYSETDSTA